MGIGVATGAALAIDTLIGEPRSLGSRLLTLATFAAVGAVEGTALAGFQWRVLRTRLPRLRAAEWIGVPSGAPGEPGLMIVLLMAAIAGAGAGVCFGVAQWFVLRRHAERAARWIWIHVAGWALAMRPSFSARRCRRLNGQRGRSRSPVSPGAYWQACFLEP